jgi:hypothetical protein
MWQLKTVNPRISSQAWPSPKSTKHQLGQLHLFIVWTSSNDLVVSMRVIVRNETHYILAHEHMEVAKAKRPELHTLTSVTR